MRRLLSLVHLAIFAHIAFAAEPHHDVHAHACSQPALTLRHE